MRIFDFSIQSILLLGAIGSAVMGKEGLVFIALIQFAMGCWQLISAIVNTIHRDTEFKKKMMMVYWIAVAGYFVGLAFFGLLIQEETLLFAWFFSAWLIAIFYYFFTIRTAFYKDNEHRSFLDIANE